MSPMRPAIGLDTPQVRWADFTGVDDDDDLYTHIYVIISFFGLFRSAVINFA